MVERVSVTPQIATGNAVAPVAAQPSFVSPVRVQPAQPSLENTALNALLGIGGEIAGRTAARQAQEAYLKGQQARSLGDSMESVESDVLSRRFVRGGWNDQDYRLAESEMLQGVKGFLAADGAALSPEEFSEYLRQSMAPVSEMIGDNLSPEMRARAVASLAQSVDTMSALHSKAHREYSLAQVGKRYTTQGNELLSTLTQARASGDPAAASKAMQGALQFYTDVSSSSSLPEAMRQEVGYNYLQALIGADQQDLVQVLEQSGALDSMSFDLRTKLASAGREADNRTRLKRFSAHYEQAAIMEARIADGKVPVEEVRSYAQWLTDNKLASDDQIKAMWRGYYKSLSDTESTAAEFDALMAGDLNTIAALGTDVPAVLTKYDSYLAKSGVGVSDRTKLLINAGAQVGHIPKQVGQTIGMAINAVASQDAVNPEQAQLLQEVMGDLARLQVSRPATTSAFLNAMPEDVRTVVNYAIAGTAVGRPVADSIRSAVAKDEQYKALTSFQKSGISQKFRERIMEVTNQEGAMNFIRRNLIPGDDRFAVKGAWTPDVPADAVQGYLLQTAVEQEIQAMASDPQYMALFGDLRNEDNQKAVLQDAVAKVYSRSVVVAPPVKGLGVFWRPKGSVMVMPRGLSLEGTFGTQDKTRVGNTLHEMYPSEHEDYRSTYEWVRGSRTQLEHVQYDSEGRALKRTPVDVTAVRQRIQGKIDDIMGKQIDARAGAAYEVKDYFSQEAISLTLDGTNNYGLPSTTVHEWRKGLVDDEAYAGKVYKDSEGQLTVGIGHLVLPSDNLKEGDTITKGQAEALFRQDTNNALRYGVNAANDLGVTDKKAILALSEVMYQLGPNRWKKFKKTQKAIQDKNYAQFVIEVEGSKWHKQTPKRTAKFVQSMSGHFGIK